MDQALRHRLLIVLSTVWLVATACGSTSDGDAADPLPAGEPEGSVASSDATPEEAQTSETEAEDSPGWPEKRPPPDPWSIFAHTAPADLPVVETQASAEEQLRLMFSDSIEFIATDPRALNEDFGELFESNAVEQVPDLYLAGLASRLSQSADANAIIEAHARAGLAGDFGPDYDSLFESRLAAAEQFRSGSRTLYDLIQRSRELSMEDRGCLAEVIRSSSVSCRDDEAQALVDEIDLLNTITVVDRPTLSLPGGSPCLLWRGVQPDITPEQLRLARARLAGTSFDLWLLGWQECAFTDASGEKFSDPAHDVAGATALRPVFDAVVAAALSPDLDIDFASITGPEWKVAQRMVSVIVVDAAATQAQIELASVTDPETRFVLLSLAYIASLEAWFQRTAIDDGFDDLDNISDGVAGVAPCMDYGGHEPATDCSDSDRLAGDALAVLDSSAFDSGVVAPLSLIDWESVGPEVGHCEAWHAALEAVSPAEQERVAEILTRNDIGRLFGTERC